MKETRFVLCASRGKNNKQNAGLPDSGDMQRIVGT